MIKTQYGIAKIIITWLLSDVTADKLLLWYAFGWEILCMNKTYLYRVFFCPFLIPVFTGFSLIQRVWLSKERKRYQRH